MNDTFTATTPVSVGAATKKSDIDKLYANTRYLREAIQRAGQNCLANADMILWSAGDAAAPNYWSVTNATTIARTGAGLADTQAKSAVFGNKITANGSGGVVKQTLIPSARFLAAHKGWFISSGIHLRPGANGDTNSLRSWFYDGNAYGYSDYHTGSHTSGPDADGWEWLTNTFEITASGSKLEFGYNIAASKAAWFGGATVLLSPEPPAHYIPAQAHYRTACFTLEGALPSSKSALGGVRFSPSKPCLVVNTKNLLGTAPTGDTFTDVNKNGSSMYSTRPKIVSAATVGEAAPDTTYANRCLTPSDVLTVDLDAIVGSPADLTVLVTVREHVRPFESILGLADLGA